MKSKTSLFSPALFRKNLTRFAPLWGIFLGMALISVALLGADAEHAAEVKNYAHARTLLGIFYALVYALLCASLLFRYLHRANSAYMLHAFPLNRSTQFVTNLLSGLVFAVGPWLLQLLLNLLLNAHGSGAIWLLRLFLLQVLFYLCFFGMAVFCMMLSGRTVIAVLSYLAMNLIGFVLPLLMIDVVNMTTFGLEPLAGNFSFLAPVVQLVGDWSEETALYTWPVIYAALGCVLMGVSWLLYRARHIERAGDAMVFGWAKVVFQVLFTLCAALMLGLLLLLIFDNSDAPAVPMLCFCLCIGAFVGWFGARMMLKRTIRVFDRRGWFGCGVCFLAVIATVCCLKFDLFGFQHYVPNPNSVLCVELVLPNYNGYGTTEPIILTEREQIEAVCQIHQTVLAQHDEGDDNTYGSQIHIVYRLPGNKSVSRVYLVSDSRSRAALRSFCEDPELAYAYYSSLLSQNEILRAYYNDSSGKEYVCWSPKKLREAILSDAAAGRLPIITVFSTKTGVAYYGLAVSVNGLYYAGNYSYFYIANTATDTMALFGETENLP